MAIAPVVAATLVASGAPSWGLPLVIGSIVLSFVVAAWLGKGILGNATNRGVLAKGVPATAQVLSMAETGTTVNQQPLVEFGLQVHRDGEEPYEVKVKQVLPRLLLGTVKPGVQVNVKVMPSDPRKVGIDWSAQTGGGDPDDKIAEGMFVGVTVSDTVDTDQFLTTAVQATADIDQMSETGRTVTSPTKGTTSEVFAFVLTVHRDGVEPYETKLLQGVPPERQGRFGPGATVPIGINPNDKTDVAIDWDHFDEAPPASPTATA